MSSCALSGHGHGRRHTKATTKQTQQLFMAVIKSYAAVQDIHNTTENRKQLIRVLWSIHINCQNTLHTHDSHRVHAAFMVHLLIGILCLRDAQQTRDYMNARCMLQKAAQLFSTEYATFKNHSTKARVGMKLLKFEVLFNLLLTYKLPLLENSDPQLYSDYITLYQKVFQSAAENNLSNALRFLELMHTTVVAFRNTSTLSTTAPTPSATCTLQNAELCVDLSVIQYKYNTSVSVEYLGSLLRSIDPQQKLYDSRWVNKEILAHWEPLGRQLAPTF